MPSTDRSDGGERNITAEDFLIRDPKQCRQLVTDVRVDASRHLDAAEIERNIAAARIEKVEVLNIGAGRWQEPAMLVFEPSR